MPMLDLIEKNSVVKGETEGFNKVQPTAHEEGSIIPQLRIARFYRNP